MAKRLLLTSRRVRRVRAGGDAGGNLRLERNLREYSMSLGTILLILLILLLVGALPTWGHSRSWGYGPSGGLGLVLVIVVVLLLMGRI